MKRRVMSWIATLAVAAVVVCAAPAAAWAQACMNASECTSGFCVDSVCCDGVCDSPCVACTAALKGGGVDGVCGQVPAGTVCVEAQCDGASFSFVPESLCDAAGMCLASGPPEPCLDTNDCDFDLCGMTGCEKVVKLDGTPCGQGLVCTDGSCGPDPGAASGAATGGGVGGTSGVGGASGGGVTTYNRPGPGEDAGCGCRVPASPRTGDRAVVTLLAGLAWASRRSRRARASR